MKIRPETRRRAFYDRFRCAAGDDDQIVLAQLEVAWAGSGLRRSDLSNTLREMSAHHLVMIADFAADASVRLTLAGEADAERLRHALFSRLRDWWILVRVGVRPAARLARQPLPQRRQGDPPRRNPAAA